MVCVKVQRTVRCSGLSCSPPSKSTQSVQLARRIDEREDLDRARSLVVSLRHSIRSKLLRTGTSMTHVVHRNQLANDSLFDLYKPPNVTDICVAFFDESTSC